MEALSCLAPTLVAGYAAQGAALTGFCLVPLGVHAALRNTQPRHGHDMNTTTSALQLSSAHTIRKPLQSWAVADPTSNPSTILLSRRPGVQPPPGSIIFSKS